MTEPAAPQVAPMPAVGDMAPEIKLPDDTGTLRRLSDERGKWVVLYFYPKDDTPGCTTEACEFRDANDQIEARDAEVWGVSVLGSGSKAEFKRKFGLPFSLIADENHEAADVYGTWVEKQNYGKTYWGVQRSTFLIDPEGRVARVWAKVKPEGHAAEILATLDEVQAQR